MSLLTTLALAAVLNGPVVTVVRVPTPWYAPRAWIAHKMRATQPQYAALPGLQFKAYSFELASGDFGGVYLWRSRQDAEAWFSPAWHERVQRERGVKGDVQILDLPALPPPQVIAITPAEQREAEGLLTRLGEAQDRAQALLRLHPTYEVPPALLADLRGLLDRAMPR